MNEICEERRRRKEKKKKRRMRAGKMQSQLYMNGFEKESKYTLL
jgi:hypothetical protein